MCLHVDYHNPEVRVKTMHSGAEQDWNCLKNKLLGVEGQLPSLNHWQPGFWENVQQSGSIEVNEIFAFVQLQIKPRTNSEAPTGFEPTIPVRLQRKHTSK